MKYKLTDETKVYCGRLLYRIKSLKNFADIKAGDLGGWVESENNLSQDNDCWVYGNAKVYDNAWVYGRAKVYGNAEVYGNATAHGEADICGKAEVVTKVTCKVFHVRLLKDNITVADSHCKIGCKTYTHKYWLDNIESIGKANNYSKAEINTYHAVLLGLFKQMQIQLKTR